MPIRHQCFIPISTRKPYKKNAQIFIFYDFECTQNKPIPDKDNSFEHVPNLCVAQQACDTCEKEENIDSDCSNCGKREHIFERENVVENFMLYLGKINEKFKYVTIIAHNQQSYDGNFIINYTF